MGVPIDAWRAAIGLFQGRWRKSSTCCKQAWGTESTVLVLTVILFLLVIGNIELNPGPVPCKFKSCPIVAETIASSVRHQHYHSNSKNFMYYCPSPECMYFTKSFTALNFHVSTFHRETRHQILEDSADQADKISCPILDCPSTLDSFWHLVQHLVQHLNNGTPPDGLQCPMEDCGHIGRFKKSSSFRVHLSQYHPGWRDEGCPPLKRRREDGPRNSTTEHVHQGENFGENMEYDDDEETEYLELNDDLLLDKIAKFYLQLYGEFVIPYSTIQEISNFISFITRLTHLRMKRFLMEGLKGLGVDEIKINELCYKVMMADTLFTSHDKSFPGPSFVTDHLRREYFKKNYDFHEPEEIDLSDHCNPQQTIQYVSISKTLFTLFQDATVQRDLEESFSRRPSNEDEVSDYKDGCLFKKESHDEEEEVDLFLYQDSYNPVMNALGSAKNKYKSLVVYFTLGNLRATNRSKIDSKHLVLLVRETVFKEIGTEKCFKTLLQELKKLEESGIAYKGKQLKVNVQFLLGDNLGQHIIGGFTPCFSGHFFCRFCDIDRPDFKAHPDKTNPCRSKEDYEECLQEALRTEEIYKGIKEDCVFNSVLQNFHAVSHLPPCLAHDLFEGVVSWDLAGIIKSFVLKKWFSYKFLNNRIKFFKCYGVDTPNKPAYVRSSGEKLGGHAVQNWSLLRLLPFLIGDKIKDFADPGVKLYLLLKELSEFFCGHSFLKSDLPYVRDVLIPLYFEQRSVVLDEMEYPLKPKHHYMVHYPELMLLYGPLIHLWTLGFEQKHKFFKHVCRLSRNFINVEFSCAVRHQFNLAFLATGPLFPYGCIEINPSIFNIQSYQGELKILLTSMWITQESSCRACGSINNDGIAYTRGDTILLKPNGKDVDCGRIREILTAGNEVQFVLEIFTAIFNSSAGIYEVPEDESGELKWISAKELKYAQPQPLYDFKGKLYFSLKSKVI